MGKKEFESLFNDIERINTLSNKVPELARDTVFNALYEALMNDDTENRYEQQISKTASKLDKPLDEFVNLDYARSNIDRSLLFVYLLEKVLGIHDITYDHILACYSMFGLEINSLKQNLRDLVNPKKYGFLKFINNCYETTDEGQSYCEDKKFINQ